MLHARTRQLRARAPSHGDAACSPRSASPRSRRGLAASSASAETTWLCKPGLANNPCPSSEEATVELANGASFTEHAQPAKNPPIDCFYVYPTVSSQLTENANLEIGPEEKQIAIDQASRFSQDVQGVRADLPAADDPRDQHAGRHHAEGSAIAYVGVLTAFEEYLAKYNDGRGFVLIGHSQGSAMLKQLIKEQIDPNPALRKQLVSAILLGGNVLVPKGKTVGAHVQERARLPGRRADALRGRVLELPRRTAQPVELRTRRTARCWGAPPPKKKSRTTKSCA